MKPTSSGLPAAASMERLRRAAVELEQIESVDELALALNESAQAVGNWSMRGVSKAGALKAEKALGVSAAWILEGGSQNVQRAVRAGDQAVGAGTVELVLRRLRALLMAVAPEQRDGLGRQLQALAHAPDSSQLASQIAGVLTASQRAQ